MKVVTLEPSVLQYCVENLKEKSEYYFKVHAENAVGLSNPTISNLVSLETHSSECFNLKRLLNLKVSHNFRKILLLSLKKVFHTIVVIFSDVLSLLYKLKLFVYTKLLKIISYQ